MKKRSLNYSFETSILIFGVIIISGCGKGSFTFENNKGIINSWPGQNWLFFFIILILIALTIFAVRGVSIITDFTDLLNNSKNLFPESIENLKNAIKDASNYSEENKKLTKEIIEKENKLSRLDGRIEELNKQIIFNQEKHKQDIELARLQIINDSEKEKGTLRGKIARLESDLSRCQLQIELYSYHLAKYKINVYSDTGDDFAVQKRIWIDRLSQGDLDLVLDHMAKHSRIAEENNSEIIILQRRLSTLNKERNLGTIGYNDENTKNELNRIAFSILEIIKRL